MPEDADGADEFVPLMEDDALWDGEMESFDVGDEEVLVLRVDGRIRAFDGICPHQSISLVEGELDAGVLTCRAHEWQFDADSGVSVNPSGSCLRRHEVRVSPDGLIEVRLSAKTSSAVRT